MRPILLSLCALALIAAGPKPPADTDHTEAPAWAKGKPGIWTLTPSSEGGYACTVEFLPDGAIGGLQIEVSAGCRKNYPMEDVAAWTVKGNGHLAFIDPLRKTVAEFEPYEKDSWSSDFGGGVTLEKGDFRKGDKTPAREIMTDTYSLSGPNNAESCGFALTSNKTGTAGTIKRAGACPKAWDRKGWATWAIAKGKVTLADKAGKPILVLTRSDPTVFEAGTAAKPLFFGPGVVIGG